MSSEQITWNSIVTPKKTNNIISICSSNPSIYIFAYNNNNIASLYITNNNGITWYNILTSSNCNDVYNTNISSASITYDSTVNQYEISGVSNFQSGFEVSYTFIAICSGRYDLTNSNNWNWYPKSISQYGASSITSSDSRFPIVAYNGLNSSINTSSGYLQVLYGTDLGTSVLFNYHKNYYFPKITCSSAGDYVCAIGQDSENTKNWYLFYTTYTNAITGGVASIIYSNTTGLKINSVAVSNQINQSYPYVIYCTDNVSYIQISTDGGVSFSALGTENTYINLSISSDGETICAMTASSIYIYTSLNGFIQTNTSVITSSYIGLSGDSTLTNIICSINGSTTMYYTTTGGLVETASTTNISYNEIKISSNVNKKNDNNSNYSSINSSGFYVDGYTGDVSTIGNINITDPKSSFFSNNIYQTLNQQDMTSISNNKCGLNLIDKLNSITYKLSTDNENKTYVGFLPLNIKEATDMTNCSLNMIQYNDTGSSNININAFIAPIIKSIQELHYEIKCLKKKNKHLEKKICKIKNIK